MSVLIAAANSRGVLPTVSTPAFRNFCFTSGWFRTLATRRSPEEGHGFFHGRIPGKCSCANSRGLDADFFRATDDLRVDWTE